MKDFTFRINRLYERRCLLGLRICGIGSSIVKSHHVSPGSFVDAQLWLKIKAHGLRGPICG
jgi:hypothetical protein